ncbi:MAG TPA: TIGR03667 family PPOX class F420-dependent oxidoreductase [Thermoleophilaceae bacterium]|jgi:PPOX class probable F420-dependent enzyme
MIDEDTEFGARAARHLREDRIVWMTTVGPDGTPVPRPVWFLWDGDGSVLVYSQESPRIRNIEANPRVALNFDGDGSGGDIVVLTGTAAVEPDAPPAHEVPEYVEKYGWGFESLSMTAEEFARLYHVPVRIRPARLSGH